MNIVIKDLVGLDKSLQKLIEVFAEGVGETTNALFEFDVKKIKRIGEAEAEVEKNKIIKKAEGQSEALKILNRAEKRFALEQYNKQINLENIFISTKEKLEGVEVSDEPVERDWTFRFMNIAQDISREDMQELLSKILAEEIKKPNTFSIRTLDFVKNLSKDELLLFKKIAILSSQDFSIYLNANNANNGFLNVSYGEVMQLIEIGFLQSSLTTVLKLGDVTVDSLYPLILKDRGYLFKFSEEQKSVTLPILSLTTFGKEIVPLIELEKDDIENVSKYVENLKEFWKTKKLEFFKDIKI